MGIAADRITGKGAYHVPIIPLNAHPTHRNDGADNLDMRMIGGPRSCTA